MKAELIAFLMLGLTFSILIINAAESKYAEDKSRDYGFLGGRQAQVKDVSLYTDKDMNETMSEYGFNQAPTNLLNTFNPYAVGIFSSVKFIWDFLINMISDTATTILSFFPDALPEFTAAIGGFIFVLVFIYVAYFIRGRQ